MADPTRRRTVARIHSVDEHARVVTITPELATEWLNRNDRNRHLVNSRAARYAREMSEGRWVLNGEAIKFDVEGNVLDGQHRLYACIEAGVPFRSFVIDGLPTDVFSTLDQGAKRTAADVLYVEGEDNSNTLAAAITRLWRHENGYASNIHPSPDICREVLARHPNIRKSAAVVAQHGVRKVCQYPSALACLHYLFSQRDPELADWFFEALRTGAGVEAHQPVLVLRERLIASRLAPSAKLQERYVMALTIKAWNATRKNRRISALRWRTTGDNPEPFPQVA